MSRAGQERRLIIIGAGMAGLSAGVYARMNGFRTLLFESSQQPGGVCTSWQRGAYTVDACLHWLPGSAPGSAFHRVWLELGALQGRRIIDSEALLHVEGLGDKTFTAWTDLDRLLASVRELAPADVRLMERLVRAARALARSDMPLAPPELAGLVSRLELLVRSLPVLVQLREWVGLTVGQLTSRVRSPLLREALRLMWHPEDSVFFMLVNLGMLDARQAGYPIGGSLAFARAMESRYRSLGGEVRYGARVVRILVERGRAMGVRLESGEEHRAEAVLSAADGHSTLFELLEGRYVDEPLRRFYRQTPTFPARVLVALGVRRRFVEAPHSVLGLSLPLSKPLRIASREHRRLPVRIHDQDPTLAPEGCTLLTCLLEADWTPWASLYHRPERYASEKERIAERCVEALAQRFPGLAAQVEMRDVATPVTYVRYTHNWRGAGEGWLPTPQALSRPPPRVLPGLAGFFMAGQWVQPGGGVAPCALSGRQAIHLLCHAERRPFLTQMPAERPTPPRPEPLAPGVSPSAGLSPH
jgi:phytoene dehydrogenase-like protein